MASWAEVAVPKICGLRGGFGRVLALHRQRKIRLERRFCRFSHCSVRCAGDELVTAGKENFPTWNVSSVIRSFLVEKFPQFEAGIEAIANVDRHVGFFG